MLLISKNTIARSCQWEMGIILLWKVSISGVAPPHTTSQIYIFIVNHICCRDLNNEWNWFEAFHFNIWSKGCPTIKHFEIDDLIFSRTISCINLNMRRNTIYNLNGVFTLLIKSSEFMPKKFLEVHKNGKSPKLS